MRVWLALAIDSYGRSRKETTLSIGEIAAMTNVDKRSVVRELKALGKAHMTKGEWQGRPTPGGSGNPATGNKIVRTIEKDYDRWVVAPLPLGGTLATRGSGTLATGTNKVVIKKDKRLNILPSPAVRELVDQFYDCLEAKLEEKPQNFNGGAAAKFFKQVLKSFPVAEIQRRLQFWFQSTDQFIVDQAFSVTLFRNRFNNLREGPIHASTRKPANAFVADRTEVGKYD